MVSVTLFIFPPPTLSAFEPDSILTSGYPNEPTAAETTSSIAVLFSSLNFTERSLRFIAFRRSISVMKKELGMQVN
jgi:hypothetical protein